MIVRNVEESDVKSVIEYVKEVITETTNLATAPNEFNITIEDELKMISQMNENRNSNFLLAEVDGEIAGLSNISGRENRQRLAHVSSLGISVKKKFWGIGIGTKLMESQIEYAKNNQITKINLEVQTTNESAIALYKKIGFEIEGTNKHGLKIDGKYVDLYYMGIILD